MTEAMKQDCIKIFKEDLVKARKDLKIAQKAGAPTIAGAYERRIKSIEAQLAKLQA